MKLLAIIFMALIGFPLLGVCLCVPILNIYVFKKLFNYLWLKGFLGGLKDYLLGIEWNTMTSMIHTIIQNILTETYRNELSMKKIPNDTK